MGESDRLITFFTGDYGKISAIAKGAKRSKKRFVNALEPFTCLHLSYAPSRSGGLGRIDSVEIMESYPLIRSSFDSYCMASLCCELTDKWMKESDPNIKVFYLIRWLLKALSCGQDAGRPALFFKTKLLKYAGYAPDWTRCCVCKKNIKRYSGKAKIHESGFLCASCLNGKNNASFINFGVLMTLEHIHRNSLDVLHKLAITDKVYNEAWYIMRHLHCYHLQTVPVSYGVMSNFKLLTNLSDGTIREVH